MPHIEQFTQEQVKGYHKLWFKKWLIEDGGATPTITDKQVEKSCGYEQSEKAFVAGYQKAMEEL